MTQTWKYAVAGALIWTAAGAAAQTLAIDWYTIDGGGTMFMTGGSLEIGGTFGQFDAGPASGEMTGGGLELVGGFWSVVRAGAPCNGFDPCDTNCNGTVNPFDIQEFLNLLGLTPPPTCSPCAGDADENGTVNPFDINGFLDCLSP